jgi:prepilin-type N-terminal cleavage/methylation domain-containing protein
MAIPDAWQLHQTNGFTLLEVVLVSVITALLSLGALPVIRSERANFNLQHAANTLVETIRETQQLSLGDQSTTFSIQFYPGVADYYLIKKNGYPREIVVRKVYLPQSVNLTTATFINHELIFTNQGVTIVGGTVYLCDRVSGRNKYVVVASLTARARVSDQMPSD